MLNTLEHQKIVKGQNVELWTESFGKSSLPCILLIMGAGCQGLMWHDSFCQDLAEKGYFVIRYDNRDIGKSSGFEFSQAPYNLDQLTQDALVILDDYGVEGAHVVGSSMGALIAQRLALDYPHRVLSLTLLSTGDHRVFTDAIAGRDLSQHELPPPSQEFINLVRHYKPPTNEQEFLDFGVEFLRIVNGNASFDSTKARNLQKKLFAHTSHHANPLNHFYACDISPGCLQRLKEIQVPTLIIHGDKDTLFPIDHGKKLKNLISHAKWVVISEMGHFLSEDFLAEVAGQIYRHILPIRAITFEKEQKKWHEDFESIKKELRKAFSPLEIDFYHIGSTSIPNALAKPIVDILGIVRDITYVDIYQSKVEELNFTTLGEYGFRGRRFFKRPDINLHIFEDTSVEAMRHLSFRNFLTEHKECITEYNELKEDLVRNFPYDMKNYILGKNEFIKKIDMMAAMEGKTSFLTKKVLRKNKWTPNEIINANEINMLSHMSYFCHYVSKLNSFFHPHITLATSTIEDNLFNYALFAKFEQADVLEKIDEVRTIFENKPFTWWVGEKDKPPYLGKHLEEKGFVAVGKHLGMFCDLNKFKNETKNILEIEKVENRATLEEFGSCVVTLGFPQIAFEEIFLKAPPLLYLEGAPLELYVGKRDGKTVSTGALFFQGGAAGIYYIATLPEYQRRGYATMMLEFLLQRAKDQGYFLSVLQTTNDNKGIYSSLGFKVFTQITEYA